MKDLAFFCMYIPELLPFCDPCLVQTLKSLFQLCIKEHNLRNAVCRSLQQQVDMLNSQLADSSLQVGQLKAEMAARPSKGQHDAGKSQIADMGDTGLGERDMQLQHADLASEVNTLKAKASSHTCHVSKLVEGCFDTASTKWMLPAVQFIH